MSLNWFLTDMTINGTINHVQTWPTISLSSKRLQGPAIDKYYMSYYTCTKNICRQQQRMPQLHLRQQATHFNTCSKRELQITSVMHAPADETTTACRRPGSTSSFVSPPVYWLRRLLLWSEKKAVHVHVAKYWRVVRECTITGLELNVRTYLSFTIMLLMPKLATWHQAL